MGVFGVFVLFIAASTAMPEAEKVFEDNRHLAKVLTDVLLDPNINQELLFDLKKENQVYVNRTMSLIIKYIIKRSKIRIKAFSWVIENLNTEGYRLNDSTVVIDAQDFFYGSYRDSGLQYIFGCESDKFADYLRKHLNMFKKANVDCYFIFKGGHSDVERSLTKNYQLQGRDFGIDKKHDDIVMPIYMKDVYKQVLEEMNFKYTICEFEAKKECLALARKLNCPIMSCDIIFAFFGHPYIPSTTLVFSEHLNLLTGEVFSLDRFLEKYNLTEEKLAVFTALTDLYSFPEDHFKPFIKTLDIPLGPFKRNIGILEWLGTTTRKLAIRKIFQHLNKKNKAAEKKAFQAAEKKALGIIRPAATAGIPIQYFQNGNKLDFLENDPFWFKKGVALKHIPIPLINISRAGIVVSSWAIAKHDTEDAMLFSMDIIKYAYNLLTNFQEKTLVFKKNGNEVILPVTDSVQKPDYYAVNSPFEHGWERVPKGLFDHFLRNTIDDFISYRLETLPEDCRILMIALIYFTQNKKSDVSNEALCVLLCYVALNIKSTKLKKTDDLANQFRLDSIDDVDKQTAQEMLKKYFEVVDSAEAEEIFNRDWLHPLVQFQHCLEFLNHLNTLCGCPYKPIIFCNTFNGTFVYKVLWTIKTLCAGDGQTFVKQLLEPAPTVLNFFTTLFEFMNGNI